MAATGKRAIWAAKLLAMALAGALPAQAANSPDPSVVQAGEALYGERCAQCHDNPTGRTPARYVLQRFRSPDTIVATLTNGAMRPQAQGLSAPQIAGIATFLTGRVPGGVKDPDPHANLCTADVGRLPDPRPGWNGWGRESDNARFQPDPGIKPAQVPRLAVKWVFAYPDGGVGGQPVVVNGRVYITSRTGRVFALDARTGCTFWSIDAGAPVRTAVTIAPFPDGRRAVFFGDDKGVVHAVDAATGQPLWTTQVEEHPVLRLTGSPVLHDRLLYVPVSSLEEGAATDPKYSCCSFRGSLAALDVATGVIRWKSFTIEDAPKPTRLNSAGTQMFGPAGGAIWSTPTIDAKRGLVFVGTGDSYTDVPSGNTNALIAYDLKTGVRRWSRQVLANDAWLSGCETKRHPNCPEVVGPDHDFGSSPILRTLPDGRQILVAGDKGAVVYGFDPDQEGRILWRTRVGKGGIAGGVMWGPAADDKQVYVAVSDYGATVPNKAQGGLSALKLATGEKVWSVRSPEVECGPGASACSKAQSAAVTAMPGIVFSGTRDGHLRAYETRRGSVVWDFDTARSFPAVNAAEAKGGGIDGGAQIVAGGTLFVNSGAAIIYPGNALIAFTVDGK